MSQVAQVHGGGVRKKESAGRTACPCCWEAETRPVAASEKRCMLFCSVGFDRYKTNDKKHKKDQGDNVLYQQTDFKPDRQQ